MLVLRRADLFTARELVRWACATRQGRTFDFFTFRSRAEAFCSSERMNALASPVVPRISLGPSSIPSPGDRVMLNTAWIDRPVDTRGCTPLPRPFRAAWKCSHARAICDR